MVIIYLININMEIDPFQWEEFLSKISEERRERIRKYKFEKDKKRCLLAEVLLRFGLKSEFCMTDAEIHFLYNQYGKPYLKNNYLGHFNISHSGEWVICAIADREVGLDIEKVGDISLDIAKRILTNEEFYLFSGEKVRQQDRFYRYWTLKEAYTKAKGYGMTLSFADIQFNDIYKNISVCYKKRIDEKYFFVNRYIDDNHLMAICIEKEKYNIITYKFIDNLDMLKLSTFK